MAYTTIDDPEKYFQAVTYTGNGSTQSITLPGDSDMQPDMVWFKRRDDTDQAKIHDSVRGVDKRLSPSATSAQADDDDVVTAFNSDGFSLGDDDSSNASSASHIAWCWKESVTAGFDIISYTGNATNRTISHSLSAVPHMMVVKNTVDPEHWRCYHHKTASDPETDYINFSLNEAVEDNNLLWNDTAPTSSVFTVGTESGVNGNTDAMIAYLWTAKQGYSKFGSYTGNGSTDGTFVYTGFRPAFLIQKRIDVGNNWNMYDNKMNSYNVVSKYLYADSSVAEITTEALDFLSNGFKCRHASTFLNTSGGKYVYMAFAEAPFVNSNGVPCNAR